MTLIATIIRCAVATCFRMNAPDEPGLLRASRQSNKRVMLVLGAAACIIAQHAAMPPRQHCPAGLAMATAQIWSG